MAKTLILAGGGHVTLAVLRLLAEVRPKTLDVRLFSDAPALFYSGILPGWVAGHYRLDALRIELAGPARRAGAELVIDPIAALDADNATVTSQSGKLVSFDSVLLATGSESRTQGFEPLGDRLLPLRPIGQFVARWPALVHDARKSRAYRLAVVGGGAGGVEIALAASQRFARDAPAASVVLVSGASGLLPGHPPAVARKVETALKSAGIQHIPRDAAGHSEGLLLSDGHILRIDSAIATTGAMPPPWLLASGLQRGPRGFVAVNACQQALSHPNIFAAGDIADRNDQRITRSGLHAVRAGQIVAHNLLAALSDRPLRPYVPWKPILYLLATRPGHAIASGNGWSVSGQWLWTLKDWIDRRYVDGFRP